VELAISSVILFILALMIVPHLRECLTHLRDLSRMTEGIVGVGVISGALRVYSSMHEKQFPVYRGADGNGLGLIGIPPEVLKGRYFRPEDYSVVSDAKTFVVCARSGAWVYSADHCGAWTVSRVAAPAAAPDGQRAP
jgi:hypothetical protein